MIKPVTFQGAENFKANLYALEVRSRFVDQSAANGYYAGYGNELAATVSSNVISIGTGAFLVQGRLIEVETAESLSVVIQNGKYGLVIARIETYPAANTANCSLVVRTENSISSLLSGLTQENTYQYAAETTNKVYELPLYSFYMTGGAITITEKVISEIKEITEIKQKADTAKSTADTAAANASAAVNAANAASESATAAVNLAHTKKLYIHHFILSKDKTLKIYLMIPSTSSTSIGTAGISQYCRAAGVGYCLIASGFYVSGSTCYTVSGIQVGNATATSITVRYNNYNSSYGDSYTSYSYSNLSITENIVEILAEA